MDQHSDAMTRTVGCIEDAALPSRAAATSLGDMRDSDEKSDGVESKPGVRGFRFMGNAAFGPLGALMGRLGRRDPIKDFDPEAFQHGASGSGSEDTADPRAQR
jgi:hypothetical protein